MELNHSWRCLEKMRNFVGLQGGTRNKLVILRGWHLLWCPYFLVQLLFYTCDRATSSNFSL